MAKVFDFKEAIKFMEAYGFYDVVLPFLLVFTILFATLQKIGIFGKESKRYNLLISAVISFMFVAATNLVKTLNEYLPIIGLVLALFLGLMLLLGMFGIKGENQGTKILGWVITGGVIVAIGFNYISNLKGASTIYKVLGEHSTTIIIFAVILGVILAMVKGGGEKEAKKPD